MARIAEIQLEYQNYIEHPPVPASHLYSQACQNDGVTIDSWRPIWIANIRANHERFGPFKDRSVGKFWGQLKQKPVIIAGSGPSLKYNGHELANRDGIPLVSCLHNFHFFEDLGAAPEFYVTLDAGEVTVEEVSEGGSKSPEEYWAMTKHRKLLAFIGTHPKLLEKWQGEIYFFNAPVPDLAYMEEIEKIEPFHCYVGNGGNVLGACLYLAKGFFGGNPICFVGADFSFSYDKKFHGWKSKYDQSLGYTVRAVDVFGNRVHTWQSYANFKAWFDCIALKVPGIWINATEGGCFGAYPEGNLMAVKQMELNQFLGMYRMHEELRDQAEAPAAASRKLLF